MYLYHNKIKLMYNKNNFKNFQNLFILEFYNKIENLYE